MLEIDIISESDIISSGLASILSNSMIPNITVATSNPNDYIAEHNASPTLSSRLIFVDTLSVDSNTVTKIREKHSGQCHISGVYISALPANRTDIYDSLVSIYTDRTSLIKIVDQAISTQKTDETSTDELTPREKEIVIGVVKGYSNKEIANNLNVSVHTVMTHRRNIAAKLQIHSPSGLTIYAIVSKLVSIDEIKSEMLK